MPTSEDLALFGPNPTTDLLYRLWLNRLAGLLVGWRSPECAVPLVNGAGKAAKLKCAGRETERSSLSFPPLLKRAFGHLAGF